MEICSLDSSRERERPLFGRYIRILIGDIQRDEIFAVCGIDSGKRYP